MKKILIVLPVYNEEKIIKKSITKILNEIKKIKNYEFKILICDNGSNDKTAEISKKISENLIIDYTFIKYKGRGNAIKTSWLESDADILTYMDIDLSTDIKDLKKLINSCENYDLVIGCRYCKESNINRNKFRLFVSKTYNFIIRYFFKSNIKDFQCGFKAITKNKGKKILKLCKNKKWFFDTELVLISEKKQLDIFQLPVKWKESDNSKVNIFIDILDYLHCIFLFCFRIKKIKK